MLSGGKTMVKWWWMMVKLMLSGGWSGSKLMVIVMVKRWLWVKYDVYWWWVNHWMVVSDGGVQWWLMMVVGKFTHSSTETSGSWLLMVNDSCCAQLVPATPALQTSRRKQLGSAFDESANCTLWLRSSIPRASTGRNGWRHHESMWLGLPPAFRHRPSGSNLQL